MMAVSLAQITLKSVIPVWFVITFMWEENRQTSHIQSCETPVLARYVVEVMRFSRTQEGLLKT